MFIYGGGFLFGTSRKSWYDPELLVGEDMVVVQPNYRLGAFGWITDGSIIPKNIALKDVICALQWVQKHIHEFGGDPKQVTLYGESAGSGIVCTLWHSYQRIKNLFHAVFLQSGVTIAPWAIQKRPEKAYHHVLKSTRCADTIVQSSQVQVDCLKSLTYTELNIGDLKSAVVAGIFENVAVTDVNSAIVMEDADDPNAIVISNPLDQLKRGDIRKDMPIMISITNDEMFTFAPRKLLYLLKKK